MRAAFVVLFAACSRSTTAPPLPPAPDAPKAVQISLGPGAGCARLSDRSVRCWGTSLGPGSPWNVPTEIPSLAGADRVSASWSFVCARGAEWRCVTGSGPASPGPELHDAQQVIFGDGDACTLGAHGDVSCRGDARPRVSGAAQIALGFRAGCALLTDGTAKCWGANLYGQLGDGTRKDPGTPVAVADLSHATQLAFTSAHACARIDDGTVRCWGRNELGELGDGTTVIRPKPVPVLGLTHAAEVAVGDEHSCARLDDGTVRCWGANRFGMLGDGTVTEASLVPVAVAGLTDVVELAATALHTCARRRSGDVWCWGGNAAATLGDGTTTNRARPVRVRLDRRGPISNEPEVASSERPLDPAVPCEEYPKRPPPNRECLRCVRGDDGCPTADNEGYVFTMCASRPANLPPQRSDWEIRCRIKNVVAPPTRAATAAPEIVFVGTVAALGREPGYWSGFVSAFQRVDYTGVNVLKGTFAGDTISVDHILVSGSKTADRGDTPRLSPALFRNGAKVIVSAQQTERGVWVSRAENTGTIRWSPEAEARAR